MPAGRWMDCEIGIGGDLLVERSIQRGLGAKDAETTGLLGAGLSIVADQSIL